MKKQFLIIIFLINLIYIPNLSASTGLLKSATIIECEGKYYGTHGSDNHYHEAEQTSDGKWKAKGDSLGNDWVCPGTSKSVVETKELEKITATFNKCVDGDTAVFNVSGKETKFRFLAIDTPETVHPTKGEEAYGKNASEYTCNKLTNASSIEIEYEDEKTDKYGRSLGWIWVDNSLLQKELVENGLGEVAYIYGNYKYTSLLCETQKTAINNKVGIWENGTRKEGYCSTLKNQEETKINNEEPKEDEKNYTKETIGGIIIVLIALLIKLKK